MHDVKAKVVIDALGNMVAGVVAETLIDTLAKVKAKSQVDALAYWTWEVNPRW